MQNVPSQSASFQLQANFQSAWVSRDPMHVSLPQAEVEEGEQSKLGEVSSTGTGFVDGHSTISLPPTWNTYLDKQCPNSSLLFAT